jgi:hypothetical protein
LEDQYTFGVRLTDHQPAIAIRMRLTRGALNEGRSRTARCPLPYGDTRTTTAVLHADSQALGALRTCGYSAVGAIESEISGTGLQGQVRYGGVDQDLKPPVPGAESMLMLVVDLNGIRCNVYWQEGARPYSRNARQNEPSPSGKWPDQYHRGGHLVDRTVDSLTVNPAVVA